MVWTDTLQAVIMFVGSTALCIQGTYLVGGPSKVWNAAARGGRLNFMQLSKTLIISPLNTILFVTFAF